MRESTQDFIMQVLVIIAIGGFLFMLFGGLGYMIYKENSQKERMYTKCMDTCERVFQEQKLIECMSTCNDIGKSNQTVSKG